MFTTQILAFVISSSSMVPQTRMIDVDQVDSEPLLVPELASFCSKGVQTMEGVCSFTIIIPNQRDAPDFHFFAYDFLMINRLDIITNSTGGARLLISTKGLPEQTVEIGDYRKVDLEANRQINVTFAQGVIIFQFDAEKVTIPNQILPAFDYLRATGLPQDLSEDSRVRFRMDATINDVNRPVSTILQLLLATLFVGSCFIMMQTYISSRDSYLNLESNE